MALYHRAYDKKVASYLHLTLCVRAQICDAYGANRYPFPEEVARQRQMHSEVGLREDEAKVLSPNFVHISFKS